MTKDELIELLTTETKSGALVWAKKEQGLYTATRGAAQFELSMYRDCVVELMVKAINEGECRYMTIHYDSPLRDAVANQAAERSEAELSAFLDRLLRMAMLSQATLALAKPKRPTLWARVKALFGVQP